MGRAVNEAVVVTLLGRLRLQLRLHPDPARHPPRDLGDQVSECEPWRWLAPPGTGSARSATSRASAAGSWGLVYSGRVMQLLRRVAAPGRDPDPRLDDRDLGPDVLPRAHLRDRGRLPDARPGRPRLRGRVRGLVRPARDRAVRLRLHDGRQGRHRDRRRARRDADLRRDRRARGDGRQPDDLPRRRPACSPPG